MSGPSDVRALISEVLLVRPLSWQYRSRNVCFERNYASHTSDDIGQLSNCLKSACKPRQLSRMITYLSRGSSLDERGSNLDRAHCNLPTNNCVMIVCKAK